MNFHKIDDNPLVFARDLGFFQNRRLINHYPDKKVYIANFNNKEWNDNKLPEIFELKKENFPDILSVELEDKEWSLSGRPDYCNKYPAWDYIDKYAGFEVDLEFTKERTFFFCRFIKEKEQYSFGQHFEKEGKYLVTLHFLKSPVGAKFNFSNDFSSKEVDFFAIKNELAEITFEMTFKEGMNFFTIKPVTVENSSKYFIIDKIEFKIKEEEARSQPAVRSLNKAR